MLLETVRNVEKYSSRLELCPTAFANGQLIVHEEIRVEITVLFSG